MNYLLEKFEEKREEAEKEMVNVLKVFILSLVIVILITIFIGFLDKKDLESKRNTSQEQLKESFKTIEKFYKIEEIDEDVLILKRRK